MDTQTLSALQRLIKSTKDISHRLETSRDLDPLMERIGGSRFVVVGEAVHPLHLKPHSKGVPDTYPWNL